MTHLTATTADRTRHEASLRVPAVASIAINHSNNPT